MHLRRGTEGGDAPVWQGATTEHIGNNREYLKEEHAARRDAAPSECSRSWATGHEVSAIDRALPGWIRTAVQALEQSEGAKGNMKRKTFLTVASVIALAIGSFALSVPGVLIGTVKMAAPSEAANVMARTVGILLITVGLLNFLVRGDEDSPTLRSILVADLVLQLGILPIDPLAYANGVYGTAGSFVPNTIIHILLATGFAYYLVNMNRQGVPSDK